MCVCIVCCSRVQVEVDMKLDVQYCNETKESCLTSVDEVSGCMPSSHITPTSHHSHHTSPHITPSPLTVHPHHSHTLTTHITPHHSHHTLTTHITPHHSQYTLTTHITPHHSHHTLTTCSTPSPLTSDPHHSSHSHHSQHTLITHNTPSLLTTHPHHSHHTPAHPTPTPTLGSFTVQCTQ